MTRVAVIVFDHISPFHLSVPCIVFGSPPAGCTVRVCADQPGMLATSAGFRIAIDDDLSALDDADLIVIPSWRDAGEVPSPMLLDGLRRAHARGARLVGLCLGAFVLAHAGLLDGRPATTHWGRANEFATAFPRVRLQPGVLYVDDGSIVTSAGTAAGIDCCLHLLRSLVGAEKANRVARFLVVPPYRQGGQAQYIEWPLPASRADDRLGATLEWALARLDRPLRLDDLAAHAAMSRRTFTRKFRALTGSTVGAWLLHQRLGQAQRLLEQSDMPIEQVAEAAGFGSAISLRQHFAATLGVSPSAYRRTFRG
ncbi:GlxA family transcriptional regulator [Chitiniphilus eburneus]|uniref:Helix-turn-helix domain-containing protein n=1 Tax=Chitiniphilus eburneus TaxID=2571148 RepID=A0A4U0QD73_9NEIS|nr:helix-turn-helix domain-containing protein [Chitiniphilus eburneus]TJZ79100.1 helix-turn-helix domain-containing protein [Chitiniphilus eburneus]